MLTPEASRESGVQALFGARGTKFRAAKALQLSTLTYAGYLIHADAERVPNDLGLSEFDYRQSQMLVPTDRAELAGVLFA